MDEKERIAEALREAADAMQNLAMLDFCGTTWLYRSGICRSAAALLRAEPVGEHRITEAWLRQRFPWISLGAILGKDEIGVVYREVVDALCSADLPVGEPRTNENAYREGYADGWAYRASHPKEGMAADPVRETEAWRSSLSIVPSREHVCDSGEREREAQVREVRREASWLPGEVSLSPSLPYEPVGEPVLERAMKLGWLAARNPFHERMEFGIWFAAVGAKRIAEGYFAPPAAPEAQEPERATPWLKASRWNALALMAAQLRCKDNPEDAAFGKRLLTMMAEVETLVPPVSAAGEEERDAK